MPLATYTDLTAAIGNWLQRSDLAAPSPNFVQLFEACANRRLRVRQQEAVAILTPNVVVNVTGAANNGAGLVRLALASTAALSSSDQVTVAGIVGTSEANGPCDIIVVDANHIDLIGSAFTNPYVSGGTVTDVGNVPLPADYLAWRAVTWLGNPVRDLGYVHPATMATRYPNLPIDLPSEGVPPWAGTTISRLCCWRLRRRRVLNRLCGRTGVAGSEAAGCLKPLRP